MGEALLIILILLGCLLAEIEIPSLFGAGVLLVTVIFGLPIFNVRRRRFDRRKFSVLDLYVWPDFESKKLISFLMKRFFHYGAGSFVQRFLANMIVAMLYIAVLAMFLFGVNVGEGGGMGISIILIYGSFPWYFLYSEVLYGRVEFLVVTSIGVAINALIYSLIAAYVQVRNIKALHKNKRSS